MGRGRKWRGGVKRDVACVTCVGALLYFFSFSVSMVQGFQTNYLNDRTCLNRQTNGQTNGQTNSQTSHQTSHQTSRQTNVNPVVKRAVKRAVKLVI
jgi:hypothetical protein